MPTVYKLEYPHFRKNYSKAQKVIGNEKEARKDERVTDKNECW